MIVENTLSVLAFELMAAVQGVDLRGGEPSPMNKKVYDIVRRDIAYLDIDRELRIDIAQINELVRSGEIQECVMKVLKDFK
jgi:histidine ammonia-lyase